MKGIELTLPEFAFVESSGHDGDKLQGRNVILHSRSASVMEVFETDKVYLHKDVISFAMPFSQGCKIPNSHPLTAGALLLILTNNPKYDIICA